MAYDILVKNGKIVDGTGNPWFRADIGIEKNRIKKIGLIRDEAAKKTIDAKDLIVSPGFIDIHSHCDFTILVDPAAEARIRQGITTTMNGNCGMSAAPIDGMGKSGLLDDLKLVASGIVSNVEIAWNWETFGEYLEEIERHGPGINVGSMVGHGTIRANVMGFQDRFATKEEVERMALMVSQAMKEGAYGISTGLAYAPGCNADESELVELSKVAAMYNGVYATHARGQRETLIEGVKEAISIGKRARLPVIVSHHKPQYGAFGMIKESLKVIEENRSLGLDLTFDIHLETCGTTGMTAIFPPWVKVGGLHQMLEKITHPEIRERLRKDMIVFAGPGTSGFVRHGRWDLLNVIYSEKNLNLSGKSIGEIAGMQHKDPFDVVFDLLIQENKDIRIGSGEYYSEDDIRTLLKHPLSVIETDAAEVSLLVKQKGLSGGMGLPPRTFGTYPKAIGKYVRDEGLLTLEEAIKKMTSGPAQRFGIRDRGLIAEGFFADLTIFDLKTVRDNASEKEYLAGEAYANPYPDGIEYVIVNGTIAMEKGSVTSQRAGKVMRHPMAVPSHN